jgi:hypothetical protein
MSKHAYSKKRRSRRLYSTQRLTLNHQPGLERITANFTGLVRNDTMEGKDYLVAPMVMMVEGVLNGTNGPLYYPEEELMKTPGVWNHKPVVVYHPQSGSACDPGILTNRKIGVIMNTIFEDGKLKAEAWLDPERMDLVDDRISAAIQNKSVMELSTGLYTDNEEVPGEFNGTQYDAIARNYRPDHLALLPDQIGACSVKDGAGFLRLNQAMDEISIIDISTMADDDKKYIVRVLNKRAAEIIANQMSHSNIRGLLSSMLRSGGNDSLWIDEVFDTFIIYEDETGKLYKQTYVIEDNPISATFVGEREEVVRVTEFRTLTGQVVGNVKRKEIIMNKTEMIDALITNKSTQWVEEDRETLNGMTENALEKMSPVENKEEPTKVAVAANKGAEAVAEKTEVVAEKVENKATTPEEYIALAPEGMQDVLRSGLTAHNKAKAQLVDVITANEKNTFSKEALLNKELDELQSLASLAANTEESQKKLVALNNYQGQVDPVEQNAGHTEEPLESPSMNFEQK